MRSGERKSIGHNIADSLSTGTGLPIGLYGTDIFGEASQSAEGCLSVDFLAGTSTGALPSDGLAEAIKRYQGALAKRSARQGADIAGFRALTARCGVDPVQGCFFTVSVEGKKGHRSVDT